MPYNQAFSQEHICKAFETTGMWPVNCNSITPDQTVPSIGLSSCGAATISPTSPVKAINTVLLQLPALLPSLASLSNSTSPTPLTSDLQHAWKAYAECSKTLMCLSSLMAPPHPLQMKFNHSDFLPSPIFPTLTLWTMVETQFLLIK